MPDADRVLMAVMLENALLKNKGQAFQDFFFEVGTALWRGDFEPWRPQGRFGDMKCDGYRITEKTVFQCYAPETFVASTVATKIQSDFSGARDNFGKSIRKWVFVHNHRGGFPSTINMLIAKLREEHDNISIETWSPNHLVQLLLELSESELAGLFPTLVKNQSFNDATWEFLDDIVKENKGAAPGTDVEPQVPSNRLSLDDALDALDRVDREVRRRVLGYCRWYDPASKTEIYERLALFGHQEALVQRNAQRLHDAGLIKITENHYLPLNEEVCQQAAESLMDEFLRDLEE
ncbi:MAG: hypothetical protein MN733_31990 [Nitrososphaera sp.]|nr:hypothetical protein [Nitrososphaera sp.]